MMAMPKNGMAIMTLKRCSVKIAFIVSPSGKA
jgi:hypothetical protein